MRRATELDLAKLPLEQTELGKRGSTTKSPCRAEPATGLSGFFSEQPENPNIKIMRAMHRLMHGKVARSSRLVHLKVWAQPNGPPLTWPPGRKNQWVLGIVGCA